MAKLTAPIQEVSRLLDLVPFLSTHSYISLKDLAAEFGVSEREMSNELTSLSMCGLPGYTPYELIEIFFDSGFVTINNHAALDIPRALTSLEIATLLIGLEILKDGATESDIDVIAKIDELVSQLRDLIDSAIDIEESETNAFLATITKAITARQVLELNYLSPATDAISFRTVDPLEIRRENGYTYLVAFCHTQREQRNFRLDRIQGLSVVVGDVSRVSLNETAPSSTQVLLKVNGAHRAISEFFGVKEIGSDGEVAIEIFSSQWLRRALSAFASNVELLEPVELRKELASDLANILALYTP